MKESLEIQVHKILKGHSSPLYALDFFENEILTAGGDGIVAKWDFDPKSQPTAIAQIPQSCYTLKKTDKYTFIGQNDGSLYVLQNSDQSTRNIKISGSAIFKILATPTFIIALDESGTLTFLNNNLELVKQLSIATKSLRDAIVIDDKLYIGSSDCNIYVVNNFEIEQYITAHDNSVFALTNVESMIWSGGRDGRINIYDQQMDLVHKIPAHNSTVNALAYNPKNKIIASSSKDKTIRLWDSENLKLLKELNVNKFSVHTSSVNKIVWSNDYKYLISVSDDKLGVIWSIQN